MSELRHASFFSGVGGLDLGFENAGIRTVSLCEVDPYASAVLAERFPGVPNFGDITKINHEEIPNAEVYSGGFPCQDLSAAGARRGFADGTRSSLAFTFLNAVERRRPRWFVLENVPGLFSSNRGRDFGRLIREVESLGYGLAWRTMDAQWFGVAQRRRRVFIVAARDDAFGGLGADRAAEVLIECAGVCGHLATGRSTGEETPTGARPGVGTFGAHVAGAIIARHGKGINSTVEPGHIVMGALVAGLANRTGTTQDELYVGFGDRVPNVVRPEAYPDGMRTLDGVARRVDDRGELEDSRRVGNFELYDFPKEAVAPTLNARRAKDELVYGDGPLSFPSRFGSNAQVTDGIAQSFAHSAGAPAVLQTGTSYDGFNQRLEPDGPHRTLRIGRDSSDFVVPPNGIPEDDDPFNPIGLDSNRYRCIGNGVVAPVAEFIGRRIVAVDAKYWKEANA
jgi:site-specific DNA-cytosine methylase